MGIAAIVLLLLGCLSERSGPDGVVQLEDASTSWRRSGTTSHRGWGVPQERLK
jgi:hypothetical protein